MKSKTLSSPLLRSITLSLAVSPVLNAASGNLTATGTVPNWATASNWSTNPNPAPGIAAGDVVGVGSNITASSTLSINSISRIVGTLNIGDFDNSHGFIINTATGSGLTLTFNNSGSGASLNEVGSVTDTIATNVGVILADNLAASVGGRLHINGPISETGGAKNLTKSGTGVLQLANSSNSYTGVTAITGTQGGILVTANNTLGTTAGNTTVAAGTSLGIAGGVNYTAAETVVGSGAGSAAITGAFTGASRGFVQGLSGSSTFAGAIQIDATGISRIGTQDGGSLTLSGPITMAGTTTGVNVLFRAGNTAGDFITLSNTGNSWDGQTQIFSGNTTTGSGVRLGASNALPTSAAVVVVNNSTSGTRLDLAGFNQEVGGLILNTAATFLKVTNSVASTTSVLTLNTATDRLFDEGGVIEDGSGIVEVAKTGVGTQVLGGTHTYSGATKVSGGKLVVAGSIGNSAVTVSGAGTVLATDAAASFGSTLAINNGAILAPGDAGAAGMATVTGATTFNNGSIFSWDINATGTSYDKLVSSSLVDGDAAGGAILRIVASDATFADTFWDTTRTWNDIFTTNGSSAISNWANIFTSVTVVDSGFASITPVDGSFSVSGNTLTWTAVPEPTSAMAGLLIAAGLLRRRRA